LPGSGGRPDNHGFGSLPHAHQEADVKLSADRILTTHAGSLPRPDDLAQMLYDVMGEKPVDADALRHRTRDAVSDVVKRQRDIGIDAISDGEMGKVGFSNYVMQHLAASQVRHSRVIWPMSLT
jgi:methionine synthase II (cobalamin-independent)